VELIAFKNGATYFYKLIFTKNKNLKKDLKEQKWNYCMYISSIYIPSNRFCKYNFILRVHIYAIYMLAMDAYSDFTIPASQRLAKHAFYDNERTRKSIAGQRLAISAFRSNEYAGRNQGIAPELTRVYTTMVR
jgi:hypothetical protein